MDEVSTNAEFGTWVGTAEPGDRCVYARMERHWMMRTRTNRFMDLRVARKMANDRKNAILLFQKVTDHEVLYIAVKTTEKAWDTLNGIGLYGTALPLKRREVVAR